MMRVKLIAMLATTLATLAAACAADGQTVMRGGYTPRPPGRVVWCYPTPAPTAYVPAYAATAPAPVQTPAPPQWSAQDEATAFLSALNTWRSWHGRGPLQWDTTLAAWAAAETGVHAVLCPGASQCWSSSPSLLDSLRMWQASPAHAAILLGATVSVGASPCPSGAACNAR